MQRGSKTKRDVDDHAVDFITFVKTSYARKSILHKPENLELKRKKFYNFNEMNPMKRYTLKSKFADLSSKEAIYWKYIDDFMKVNSNWFNLRKKYERNYLMIELF
jgi:hypothetical protein